MGAFGVTWGVWGHLKGGHNGMERFGVTPRRNMGWDWGHPKKYGMRSLGSSYEGWDEDFGVTWGVLGAS